MLLPAGVNTRGACGGDGFVGGIRVRRLLRLVRSAYPRRAQRDEPVTLNDFEVAVGPGYEADVGPIAVVAAEPVTRDAQPRSGVIGTRGPRPVERLRREDGEGHHFADDQGEGAVRELDDGAVVAVVRVRAKAVVAVGETVVGKRAEHPAVTRRMNRIGARPGGESSRPGPAVGKQMIGAVRSADDFAVPVVVAGRVLRALDPVTRVAWDDAHALGAVGRRCARRGASPGIRRERADDRGRLKIVDESLLGACRPRQDGEREDGSNADRDP